MTKFILRKTAFKKYSKKTQNRLISLLSQKYTTMWLCWFMFHFITLLAPVILLMMSVHNQEFDSIHNIILGAGILLYECLWMVTYFFFRHEIFEFCTVTLPDKLYGTLYSQRGKAISKSDFKIIEKEFKDLYNCITSCLCHGYCYSVCFDLLKTLKKVKLKFIAIEALETEEGPYTMHVLYENNGWTFDTYNQRQYPVSKNIALHNGIVYKDFYYEDIKRLTYDEFKNKNYAELAKWCEEHDCFQKWIKDD